MEQPVALVDRQTFAVGWTCSTARPQRNQMSDGQRNPHATMVCEESSNYKAGSEALGEGSSCRKISAVDDSGAVAVGGNSLSSPGGYSVKIDRTWAESVRETAQRLQDRRHQGIECPSVIEGRLGEDLVQSTGEWRRDKHPGLDMSTVAESLRFGDYLMS
ncbi:MAG: hypothetical protein M1817_000346 [Caeruleum heppii]|nr:MAG: hypothetical protein M1817_000346 [Caeruleum heppii]